MPSVADYRATLGQLAEWEPYLLTHSGLPGPRGNLELAHAVADEGDAAQFLRWAALVPDDAPENTPELFLAFCGALGLGELLARGGDNAPDATMRSAALTQLRGLASDPRWRVREAVATGLQRWGSVDMPALLAELDAWSMGNYYEQRAAVAALCEPRLLVASEHATSVLDMLDRITRSVAAVPAEDRKSDPFRTLRQGLGYCWSVAVAAHPETGVPYLQRWLTHTDLDVRWIMRENLRKKRLAALQITLPE